MQTVSAEDVAKDAKDKAKKVSGRKDGDGQEATPDSKPLRKMLKELDIAYQAAEQAKQKFGDIVKKVAEKSHLQSAVVRKMVKARSTDSVEEVLRDAQQIQFALEETADIVQTPPAPTAPGSDSKQ
jgi:hypothetical protein